MTLLVFGWLCLRCDRWWPAVAAAAAGLIVLGDVLRLLDPTFSHFAMVSAKIGLAYVIDLALLLGIGERWLAGEPPAGQAAWAKVARTTAARRNRKDRTRPVAGPTLHRDGVTCRAGRESDYGWA